jgi:hypothetical protein
MNEQKPEDVMRALECCASGTGGDACNGCPFNERKVCDNDMNALEKAALALLREKDAEIERLKDEYEIKCEARFGKITIPKMRSLGEGAELIYKEIRAEAIADVVAQLEAEVYSSDKYVTEYDGSKVQIAYNQGLKNALKIVKEMEDGENGKSDL